MSRNWCKRVTAAHSLLFTGKKERRAAKQGPEEKAAIIKPAPEETEVTSKPASEEKAADSEGMLKTNLKPSKKSLNKQNKTYKKRQLFL